MKQILWQAQYGNATFGIVTDESGAFVLETAPIGRWMLGKSIQQLKNRGVKLTGAQPAQQGGDDRHGKRL